jgi:polysaccharide deacetylase family protein (PEP-CTERM system associated)
MAQPLLLSVDFEDWHQLVRRRVGVADREQPGPALERQTEALLVLLDEIDARATFFILAMAAREYPALVSRIARAGHEIACHGDQHLPVHSQSPESFANDVRRARETVAELTARQPVGYRAPAFSITRDSAWAYDVLVSEGFAYDSSQHDSPRLRHRIRERGSSPHVMELAGGNLWEFPIAVWSTRAGPVPVGGASYWAVLPTRAILHGLDQAGALAGLYLHPQELDPRPLRAELPSGVRAGQRAHGMYRAAQRNLSRWRTAGVLRAIASRHELIPYGEGHARLAHGAPTGT